MVAALNRDMQHVLLVLVGGAVLRISVLSDSYLRYVKGGMRPFLVAAGASLLTLGLLGVVWEGMARRRRNPRVAVAGQDGDHGPQSDHDHEHCDEHGPRVAWLLCLPVFAIFFIAPPPLGSYAVDRSTTAVAPPATETAAFPPLAAGDPLRLQVNDFTIRAVWDKAESLRGRTVELTGFVTPKKGGGWYLTRLTMACCAADALPYKIEVVGAAAPSADTWVRLTGTWLPNGQVQSDTAIPAIQATTLQRIAQPDDPYE
jgi:uncharacterized repeat protein (TIGR03943 family)